MYLLPTASTLGPNWADQLVAWSTLALAIGVLLAFVGVLLARQSVKESVKTRHAQIAMEMTQRWDTDISPVKRTVARIEDVPFSVELR